MTIDLTGGLSEELEHVFAAQPDDPEMRESVNAWIWDDGVEFGLPRIGIEAVADQWDTHDVQVNVAFADGRVYQLFAPGPIHDPFGGRRTARVLGAGPLSFEVVEPYGLLRMRFQGEASGQLGRRPDRRRLPRPGRSGADRDRGRPPPGRTAVDERRAARGRQARPRHPGGGRPHGPPLALRAAVPRHGAAAGRRRDLRDRRRRQPHPPTEHPPRRPSSAATPGRPACSRAAAPSGTSPTRRATTARTPTTRATSSRATVPLVPARVVEAPWLRTLTPKGEDVSCVLETEDGRTVTITGETAVSTFMVMPPDVGAAGCSCSRPSPATPGTARRANGMLERSTRRSPTLVVTDHAELLATAQERTGLTDFGDDSFREGLERLVARAARRRRRSTPIGEVVLPELIVKHLAQRLQIEDWYRRHPEIDDEPIDAPLIGLGLPRTGSTALSILLAEDPERAVAPALGGRARRARRRRPSTGPTRASPRPRPRRRCRTSSPRGCRRWCPGRRPGPRSART